MLISGLILFALVMGSFLNVVIYRLPLMLLRNWGQTPGVSSALNLAWPASHCVHCQNRVAWHDNIPLFSFAWLRGHCRHCQQAISWRYPLIEALTAVLSVMLALHYGFTTTLLAALVFTYALLALTFIDIDHHLLPDRITLPLLGLGLALNFFGVFTSMVSALLGAVIGYLSLWAINWGYTLYRKRTGIGLGDCKLLAALGAWLGVQALVPIVLMASLSGLLIAGVFILSGRLKADAPVAFGPFLALAGWLYLLFV